MIKKIFLFIAFFIYTNIYTEENFVVIKNNLNEDLVAVKIPIPFFSDWGTCYFEIKAGSKYYYCIPIDDQKEYLAIFNKDEFLRYYRDKIRKGFSKYYHTFDHNDGLENKLITINKSDTYACGSCTDISELSSDDIERIRAL